jgi:hypothetical protein
MGDRQPGYGDDDWPLGEDFHEEDALARLREWQFRADMARCKAEWDAGDLTAAARAVRECIVRRVPDLGLDADWLIDAVRKLADSAMEDKEQRQRREWDIHQTRSEMFTELCERRDELSRTAKANLAEARGLISSKATDPKERARLLERLPEFVEAAGYDWGTTSLDRVREIVSEKMGEGHSPGAIKRSCKIVEDAGGEAATFESYLAILHERGESDD